MYLVNSAFQLVERSIFPWVRSYSIISKIGSGLAAIASMKVIYDQYNTYVKTSPFNAFFEKIFDFHDSLYPTPHDANLAFYRNRITKGKILHLTPKVVDRIISLAIDNHDFNTLRYIFDSKVPLSAANESKIKNFLTPYTQPFDSKFSIFCTPLPKVGEIEYFKDNDFQPLTTKIINKSKLSKMPIVLINNCQFDHDFLHKSYGAISSYYNKQLRGKFYSQISDKFIVCRVRVNCKEQLLSSLDKIAKIFPKNPIRHWMLNGHGTDKAIGLQKGKQLNKDDVDCMSEIAKKLPSDASISLCGCANGAGEENIAKKFSIYFKNRIVFASENDVTDIYPTILETSKSVYLFPLFSDERALRGYINGEQMLDGYAPLPKRARL